MQCIVDLTVAGDASIGFDGLLSVDGSFTLIQKDVIAADFGALTTDFGSGAKALILNLTASADSSNASAAALSGVLIIVFSPYGSRRMRQAPTPPI